MTAPTQPDPQVVACRSCGNRGYKTIGGYMGGYRIPCPDCMSKPARRPLTTADIPAGQGAASLHITSTGGRPALWFKADDGTLHFIRWAAGPGDTPPARALWDHLAATITHVTTKENQ